MKKVLSIILLFIIALLIAYADLISYGLSQLNGQLNVMYNASPVEEVLEDKNFPDSLKDKILVIREVKSFAIHDLGFRDNDNYNKIFDQQGKELMHLVLACPKFSLEPKEWNFPIIGSFPYKGFFNQEAAEKTLKELLDEGYDARIRHPSAWSTLGILNDPILSGMLNKSEGELANTIIHELTHSNIFINDSIDFNENLASFIGDYGAYEFLKRKYGDDSKKAADYIKYLKQEEKFVDYIKLGALRLDSFYVASEGMNEAERLEYKNEIIKDWVSEIDTLELSFYKDWRQKRINEMPDNTFFMSYLTYNKMRNDFELEYQKYWDEKFVEYVISLNEKFEGNKKWYDF